MIYFIIGYMASGKTTIAKQLSKKYHIPYIDIDNRIEIVTNDTISNIFKSKGEPYFRNLESNILKEIIETNNNCIVSCGGGTPIYNDNMELMNNNGLTIYIKCDPKTIINRLSDEEINKRPLLKDKTKDDLISIISSEIKKREEFYNKANIIINYESINIEWP